MPNLGPTELIIILLIAVLLFGVGRLGRLGGELGRGIREFRQGLQDDGSEQEEDETSPKEAVVEGEASSESE